MMKKYFSTLFYKRNTVTITVSLLLTALFFTAFSNNRHAGKTGYPGKKQTEMILPDNSDNKTQPGEKNLLTIAEVFDAGDRKNIEIRFYERAAIFSIDKNSKVYIDNRGMLAEAKKSNNPVKFVIDSKTNTIQQIEKASAEEIRAYNTGDGINSPKMKIYGVAPLKINLFRIDTGTFNRAESQYYFPVLKLCTNVVPDYATLVAIFNDCASQGCDQPGPFTITNCIPFQYVIDGCYARAHKMRQMISKKYGYCVEKVFSFAEVPPSKLAVKAGMWGGCCVEWWYHVVPLLRLNVKHKNITYQVCYVIDPGMFTQPVTLSTWLQAQKNTTCNPNANVTSYSIQPGSAYWPMGSSASFGTDPNYVQTEQTLIGYKNGVTCNN